MTVYLLAMLLNVSIAPQPLANVCKDLQLTKRLKQAAAVDPGMQRFNILQSVAVNVKKVSNKCGSSYDVWMLNKLVLSNDSPTRFWSATIIKGLNPKISKLSIPTLNKALVLYKNETGTITSVDAIRDTLRAFKK